MLLLACFALVAVGAAAEGEPLPSPCPEVFQYAYDGGRWSGTLRVPVPLNAKRMVVVVSLFVLDAVLPPEHPGELQILQDEQKVKEQIRRNETNAVVYLLELPIQSPLPVIEKVKVNRNVICEGPKVKAYNRTKVTYTHRLNGLTPQSHIKPDGQANFEQGRIVDLDMYNPKKQGSKSGDKGKGNAYNNLELTENEVVETMTQEEDIFPKHKTDDLNFNTKSDEDTGDAEELSEDEPDTNLNSEWSDGENVADDSGMKTRINDDDDDEDTASSDLDLNQDAEMINNKIPEAVIPPPNGKTPDYNEEDYDDDDKDKNEGGEQDTPNNDIDPNKDAEMLDNNLPELTNSNVPNKPNSPSDDAEDDEGDADKEEDEDYSDMDLDLNEDVEILDNKISETVGTKPKNLNPSGTVEEFDDFADNELNPNYNTKASDNDIYP